MKVDFIDPEFVVTCRFEERHLPKAAGFLWCGERRRWVTAKMSVALTFGTGVLTDRARRRLGLDGEIPVPEDLSYLAYQEEGIRWAQEHRMALIADEPGLGKGHPVTTRLLTPEGYRALGSLKVGSVLIGANGQRTAITAVYERGILPVYRVFFDDGASIECDGEHLWRVSGLDHVGETIDTLALAARVAGGENLAVPTLRRPAELLPSHKRSPLPSYKAAGVDLATWLGDAGNRRTPVAYGGLIDYPPSFYAQGAWWQLADFVGGVVQSLARVTDCGKLWFRIWASPEGKAFADAIQQAVEKLGGLAYVVKQHRRLHVVLHLPEHPEVWRPVLGLTSPAAAVPGRWKRFVPGVPRRRVTRVEAVGRDEVRCISVSAPDRLYTAEHAVVTHNTMQGLGLINATPHAESFLIVCPASLKENWLREANKWLVNKSLSVDIADGKHFPNSNGVIINYESLCKHRSKLRQRVWDIGISDECFPSGTLISTENGNIDISAFHSLEVPPRVWAVDVETGRSVLRPVLRAIEKVTSKRLVRVRHAHGQFVCTRDERVFTENRGWAEAWTLTGQDDLCVLREDVRDAEEGQGDGENVLSGLPGQADCGQLAAEGIKVRDGAVSELRRGRRDVSRLHAGGVLLERVCFELRAAKPTSAYCGISGAGTDAGTGNASDDALDAGAPGGACRGPAHALRPPGGDCDSAGAQRWTFVCHAGRQWHAHAPAGDHRPVDLASDGVCDPDQGGSVRIRLYPDFVQGGHRRPGTQTGNRNRRSQPRSTQRAGEGRQAGPRTVRSRVGHVEVLECRGGCGPGGMCQHHHVVYDLEVAEHHNFFADGVLVHNCHFLMNPESIRTREFYGGVFKEKEQDDRGKMRTKKYRIEPIPLGRLCLLSGTPLPNKVSNLWTTVRACDPLGLGRDEEEFCKRYAGAYYDPTGFVKDGTPDPAMLEELNGLMKLRFMIRRHKNDVLKELPPKIRQVIPLPSDGLKAKMKEEKDALTNLLDHYEKMIGIQKDMSTEDLYEMVTRIRPETWEKYARECADGLESLDLPLNRLANARQDLAIAKIPMVVDYVQNLIDQGEKVVVFAYHQAVIEGLLERFPDAPHIYGKVPQKRRIGMVDRFQQAMSPIPFIGQYTAAGTGHTLTSARHWVAAECVWVPHEMLQAEDRCHRIGSEIWDTVWAHHLVVEGSLDDRMMSKMFDKMKIIEMALN